MQRTTLLTCLPQDPVQYANPDRDPQWWSGNWKAGKMYTYNPEFAMWEEIEDDRTSPVAEELWRMWDDRTSRVEQWRNRAPGETVDVRTRTGQ